MSDQLEYLYYFSKNTEENEENFQREDKTVLNCVLLSWSELYAML